MTESVDKKDDLPSNMGGGFNSPVTASATAAVLAVDDPVDIELKVGKTEIPKDLIVSKDVRDSGIWYTLNKPIYLPYDQDLISKVGKGAKISAHYFADVLQTFIEDTLPDLFPKGFYNQVNLDSPPNRISINPQPHSSHQHSFNLDFIRTESQETSALSEIYKKFNIRNTIFITSKILHPRSDDLITNGFFPRTNDDKLQPVEGVEIRTGNTYFELPRILGDNEKVYIVEISAPILQTLLGDSPLFFPNYPTKYNINSHGIGGGFYNPPSIKLNDSEITTISQARKFREKLSIFLINNRAKLKLLAEEFGEAKHAAKIGADNSLTNYKPEFLFKYLNEVNKKIEEFRKEVPADLGFKELFRIED